MPLQPGHRIGAYEILSTLGAGGMGVVYRARDGRLGRDVAIKTLPEAVAADPDRLARFEREARALAALNHPNIATLYGFEEADATHFLTMEVVEGATLEDRIARGPIPLEQALALFIQIAGGLEAAHAKGIIHRDLKPANIKVGAAVGSGESRVGVVKILDFGLAKALTPEAQMMAAGVSQSPTLTLAATMRGEILGTAAYMSPEQAQGEAADERADIWAFGVCLLEALTGRRVFNGTNASLVLASVLKDEPDFAALPPSTPLTVRRLLRRCLEKNRERRLHDIADARLELEEALAMPLAEPEPVAAPPSPRAGRVAIGIAAAAGVAFGVAAILLFGWLRKTPQPKSAPAGRFVLNAAPAEPASGNTQFNDMAITSDGSVVIYATGLVPESVLQVRHVDRLDVLPLPGSEPGASMPFFSPDDRWVGYVDAKALTLRKISLLGGPSATICRVQGSMAGVSWGLDDTIVFGQSAGPLRRVPAAGGAPADLTQLAEGEASHRFPEFLPGGNALLFAAFGSDTFSEALSIQVVSLATGVRKKLVSGATQPRYASSGHLVYAIDTTLFAVAFDLERLEVIGDPVPVVEGVARTNRGTSKYALSGAGALVYRSAGDAEDRNVLVWVDREGVEQPIAAPPRYYVYPRVSPDGTRVALDVREQEEDIWIWDLERENPLRGLRSPPAPMPIRYGAPTDGPSFSPQRSRAVTGRCLPAPPMERASRRRSAESADSWRPFRSPPTEPG